MKLEINDRYSIVLNDSPFEFYAIRYGKRWRELAGDNLVLAMVYQMQQMRSCGNCRYETKGCDCQSCFLETDPYANWRPKEVNQC